MQITKRTIEILKNKLDFEGRDGLAHVVLIDDWNNERALPVSDAVRLCAEGSVYRVIFPISRNQEKERSNACFDELEKILFEMDGQYKTTEKEPKFILSEGGKIGFCHKQKPGKHKYNNGIIENGWFDCDGKEFHEREWQEFAKANGYDCLLCLNYKE